MAVDVGDGFADRPLVEDAFLVEHAGQESRGAEEVNLAGDAFGVVEDAAEGVVAEELAALETCDPHSAPDFDICRIIFAVELIGKYAWLHDNTSIRI